jgi:ABC-type amino acid transport system permease subunit
MKLNAARIWLGGIVGGIVWIAWGFFIGMRQAPLYAAMQKQGLFLQQPRYEPFAAFWILLIFAMSILIAYLYAWARQTAGPGPKTALKIGMIVGFCAGVPDNFAQAAWSPVPKLLPLGWMLDLWGGAILAGLVAGFLYKEKK